MSYSFHVCSEWTVDRQPTDLTFQPKEVLSEVAVKLKLAKGANNKTAGFKLRKKLDKEG